MQEIEISSRLYIENARLHDGDADVHSTPHAAHPAVTFILAGHRLVTVRYDAPSRSRWSRTSWLAHARPDISEMVLMELLDAVIDRCADILSAAAPTSTGRTTSLSRRACRRSVLPILADTDRDRPRGFDLEGA
jgi:hypothetical protein